MNTQLYFTNDRYLAKKEILELGGIINQEFTNQLFVAQLPANSTAVGIKYATPDIPTKLLSPLSALAYKSWDNYLNKYSPQTRWSGDTIAPGATIGIPWDTEGFTAPDYFSPVRTERPSTSRYLVGSVSVGIVIVSGPRHLTFMADEKEKIIGEVQEGLQFLATAEPKANVSFIYDIHDISVSANEGRTFDYEIAEMPWRNEALKKMNFTAGRMGSVEYVNSLKKDKNTDWAYVVFFTKYPLHHFAYARDEKIVMSYSNGTWGPDSINKVFAHETCHIFGAVDEYNDEKKGYYCKCDQVSGHFPTKNGNCKNCQRPQDTCLMAHNDLALCWWTRKQIGWDESLFTK